MRAQAVRKRKISDRIFPEGSSVKEDCRALDALIDGRLPPSGETGRVVLAVGGLACAIELEDRRLAALLRERYGDFLLQTSPDDLAVRLRAASVDTWLPYGRGNPGKYPQVVSRTEGACQYVLRWDFAFRLTASGDTVRGEGLVPADAHFFTPDAFVRIAYSLAAVARGGLLVHAACALKRDGTAALFPGRSGAGKTTLARLAKPVRTVLSDEITLVLHADGDFTASGTPFYGELGEGGNLTAPLGGVYFLNQAPEARLHGLSVGEAARRLLAGVLFFGTGSPLAARAFEVALNVVQAIPVSILDFTKDASFWEVIDG